MNDLNIRYVAARRYAPGEKLDLVPHDQSEPFGSGGFPPFQDDYQPRSLQPTAEELKLKKPRLKIVEPLRAGRDVGSQILLCKIVQGSTDRDNIKKHAPFPTFPMHSKVRRGDSFVVAKVFDPRLYPPRDPIDLPNEPPFDDATVAYSELCREAAVYQFFYEKGKSGHPHMIAQYYGCRVTNRKVFNNASTPDEWVGLILIEYIEGRSIENICPVDPSTGYLEPPLNTEVILHLDTKSEQQGKSLKLDRQVCLDVMKSLLGQAVVFVHSGVSIRYILPHNVFLTIRNNGDDLETPRVVLLDHTFSVVWEHSRPCKEGVPFPFGNLELPPHPWEQCCVSAVSEFLGWIPPQWDDRKWMPAKTSPAAAVPATGRASDVAGVTEETGIAKSFNYTVYPEEVSDSGEEDAEKVASQARGNLNQTWNQVYASLLERRREWEALRAQDASIPQRPRLRPAHTQDTPSRSPTRKAEAEGGEEGGGEQESSMSSTNSTAQFANSPFHQYLGGLIIQKAAGSGSDSDNEQPPPRS
ncbi:hypothetical protein CNYM01_02764 [Colletotrichum nymphaeae SA-01]|uniref:Protein kinase domain-containing protein n=1 Tax=Colletotrichum nymphaeae SA-01 TaxID=1460502 RepID=A0A135T684_9PEZI|nr:hypothetical protein CNYM01_02764 [Colletotrichum nymphaeae SA-01]